MADGSWHRQPCKRPHPTYTRASFHMTHPVKTVALAVASLMGASPLFAQGQPQAPLRVAASSYASVEVHINARAIGRQWYEEDASLSGPSRIAITYGQPHARGRQIIGGLIPTDTVWRFGANMATSLHCDVDLTLGTLAIPRGDYSLFLLHGADNTWHLIVNNRTGEWGTDRDASKDIGRVTLSARTLAEPEDALTIYLVPDSQNPRSGYATLSGVLRIKWGTVELKAPWTVKQ